MEEVKTENKVQLIVEKSSFLNHTEDDGDWSIGTFDTTEDKEYIKDFMSLFNLVKEHNGTLKSSLDYVNRLFIEDGNYDDEELNEPENWEVEFFIETNILNEYELYTCKESVDSFGLDMELRMSIEIPKSQYDSFAQKCEERLKYIPQPLIRL